MFFNWYLSCILVLNTPLAVVVSAAAIAVANAVAIAVVFCGFA